MRTLTLTALLATALAGTGCFVTTNDPSGDLDLAWRFQNSDGLTAGNWTAANSGCATAAITDLDLSVFDAFDNRVVFRNYPCREAGSGFPGAVVAGLSSGNYSYLVTAWRLDAPVFEDGGSFFVDANATTQIDATLAVLSPAPLTVYFTQGGLATCSGTPRIRYDLFTSGGTFLESNDQIACDPVSTGFTADTDRPTGVNYQVDVFAMTAGGASVSERCLTLVRHTGFPTTIDLIAAPDANCTP
jgi:hypothetical protein